MMLSLAKLRQDAKKSFLVIKSNIPSRLGDLRERQHPVLTTVRHMSTGAEASCENGSS